MVYLLGLAAAVLLAVGFVLQQHAAEPKGNGNEVIDNLEQARGNQNGLRREASETAPACRLSDSTRRDDGYQRQWWFGADRLIRGDR